MISAVLVWMAWATALLTVYAALETVDRVGTRYVWATLIFLVCTIALLFVAGVLS